MNEINNSNEPYFITNIEEKDNYDVNDTKLKKFYGKKDYSTAQFNDQFTNYIQFMNREKLKELEKIGKKEKKNENIIIKFKDFIYEFIDKILNNKLTFGYVMEENNVAYIGMTFLIIALIYTWLNILFS